MVKLKGDNKFNGSDNTKHFSALTDSFVREHVKANRRLLQFITELATELDVEVVDIQRLNNDQANYEAGLNTANNISLVSGPMRTFQDKLLNKVKGILAIYYDSYDKTLTHRPQAIINTLQEQISRAINLFGADKSIVEILECQLLDIKRIKDKIDQLRCEFENLIKRIVSYNPKTLDDDIARMRVVFLKTKSLDISLIKIVEKTQQHEKKLDKYETQTEVALSKTQGKLLDLADAHQLGSSFRQRVRVVTDSQFSVKERVCIARRAWDVLNTIIPMLNKNDKLLQQQTARKKSSAPEFHGFALLEMIIENKKRFLQNIELDASVEALKKLEDNSTGGITQFQLDFFSGFMSSLYEQYINVDAASCTCFLGFSRGNKANLPRGIRQLVRAINAAYDTAFSSGNQFTKKDFFSLVGKCEKIVKERQAIWWNGRCRETEFAYVGAATSLNSILLSRDSAPYERCSLTR